MIKTYNELYKFLAESNEIKQDVIDILFELDGTGSMVTQASLNDILKDLYNRLETDSISIEGIGYNVSQESFAAWVDDNFDDYTANLFKKTIS